MEFMFLNLRFRLTISTSAVILCTYVILKSENMAAVEKQLIF